MRLGNHLFLLIQHWRFHWASWAVVALLVFVSTFVITLIGGATRSMSAALRDWSSDIFPPTIVTIRHETPELGRLAFLVAAATISNADHPRLTPSDLTEIRALPEVETLYPVISLNFPTVAQATFMGEGFGTDAAAAGIDPELVMHEVADGERFDAVDWQHGESVPVLLSSYFIDLFNLLYAPTIGLPPLSSTTAIGFEFELHFGTSMLGGSLRGDQQRSVNCRIVGLTRNPQLMGVTMPRRTAEEIQRWWGGITNQGTEAHCTYAFARVRQIEQIEPLRATLAERGLLVESPSHMDQMETLDRLVMITSAALQLIVLGLTVFGCVCLMVLQMEHRRPSIVFLHVSGIPASVTRRLMISEAAGVALCAAALGAWGAVALLRYTLEMLTNHLPVSVPVPQLSGFESLLIGIVGTLLLAGVVIVAALVVVVGQHRRISHSPTR